MGTYSITHPTNLIFTWVHQTTITCLFRMNKSALSSACRFEYNISEKIKMKLIVVCYIAYIQIQLRQY